MTGSTNPMEEQLVVLSDPWQDKYERLLEAHEKLQKLNQCLEEKLLKLAEERQAETAQLSNQIQDLTQRLVEARLYIHQLEDENERYRNDINVAVQLLQCKPSNFISPKIDTLPEDLQRKVLGQRNGLGSGRKEKKIIKVQVPTFPPTDIMYAVDKASRGKQQRNGEKDIVSAAIMAKVLEERENERKENQKNRCHCASRIVLPTLQKETQTLPTCTISYSDFPYSDESTTTVTSSSNNNNDESQDMAMLKQNGNYQDCPSYTTYKNGLVRETSFCHHQSSSSLSSPTSSSASSTTHHRHPRTLSSHNNNNMLQDGMQSNSSSPGPGVPIATNSIMAGTTSNLAGGSSSSRKSEADQAMHRLDDKDSDDLLDGASSCSSTGTYSGNSSTRNSDAYLRNSASNNYSIMSSSGNCSGYGLVNWRTTVLVQPPPKSHSTHDSLSLLMSSHQPPPPTLPMSYSATTSPSSHSSPSNNVDLLDSEDSLGLSSSSSSISSQLPAALLPQLAHHHHSHNQTPQSASNSSGQTNSLNGYHGIVVNNTSSSYPSPQLTHQPHQYYRAQKRTFWTRSSSTTSTETEI